MRRNPVTLGLVAALVISLVAVPALAATAGVEIRGGSYYPASLTVESNTTVTWTNYDPVSHSVTSTDGLFDSGPIETNGTFEHTFTDTGTYPYGCALNTSAQRTPMQGVVIVVPEGTMVEPGGNETPGENQTPGEEPVNTTLADLIAGEANLTIFADALERANLTQTVFAGEGPYTVFAPEDAAFEALGNETLAMVLNDTEMLDTLLMHHVVEGNLTVENLTAAANATENGTVLETLAGDTLNVSMTDGNLMVENATIIVSDLEAANGIVQIVGIVLVPEGLIPTENVTPVPTENVTPMPTENVTPTPTPAENVTPAVNVSDQAIVNDTVIVDRAVINRTGWADIHADLNGTPGPIIGYSPIVEGVNENVTVAIETENATAVLYAMLHVDEGEEGVHEFPGPDVPLLVNGTPVQVAFNITGGLPAENVTPTETATPVTNATENVTPEDRVIP